MLPTCKTLDKVVLEVALVLEVTLEQVTMEVRAVTQMTRKKKRPIMLRRNLMLIWEI